VTVSDRQAPPEAAPYGTQMARREGPAGDNNRFGLAATTNFTDWVRLDFGDICLGGKGPRGPQQPWLGDSNSDPPYSSARGRGREAALTYETCQPVVTAGARPCPPGLDAVRTQCGPGANHRSLEHP
jgi:hypothetical protein